jgi:hypothetical protein
MRFVVDEIINTSGTHPRKKPGTFLHVTLIETTQKTRNIFTRNFNRNVFNNKKKHASGTIHVLRRLRSNKNFVK